MKNHRILGVHITQRVKHVPKVQQVFTEYGCFIRTRLGLHEASEATCSPNGLILLELAGEEAKGQELTRRLREIEGVDVKEMAFEHP